MPSAVSEARWYQSCIYSPKMQKYSALMKYSPAYLENLKRYQVFNILFVPYWFRADKAADVQVIDLEFFCQMEQFRAVNNVIATAVLKTWHRHTEYLSPELTFLSLTYD